MDFWRQRSKIQSQVLPLTSYSNSLCPFILSYDHNNIYRFFIRIKRGNICPNSWHIPSIQEILAAVDSSTISVIVMRLDGWMDGEDFAIHL